MGAVISLLCGVCTTTTTTTIMTCYDSSIESVHTYTRGREGERERDGGREGEREGGREGGHVIKLFDLTKIFVHV